MMFSGAAAAEEWMEEIGCCRFKVSEITECRFEKQMPIM
jgi:hypothetical protein